MSDDLTIISHDPNTDAITIDRRDDAGGTRYQRTLIGTPRMSDRYQLSIAVGSEAPTRHLATAGLLLDRDEVIALHAALGEWLNP